MRLRLAAAAVVLAATATPAAAAMDVATFLAKASALQAEGMGALFSSDLGLLKREATAAATQLRADRLARAAAGKPPLYCPPEKGGMTPNEIVAGLTAIPPAERNISLKDGLFRVIRAKHPCR